ncbi:MAG: hypothetical protein Ct9H300mP13_4470 [Gammaproteobacteria bacterium]|nr:MAG: hypothetical protein Ct9H300mP13_4470 [Gammaproteobacteria bacterium]
MPMHQGEKGITGFIVPTDSPGYLSIEWKTRWASKHQTPGIFLEVEVPFENRLGEEGQGYKIALSILRGAYGIGAQAVGSLVQRSRRELIRTPT